MREIVAAGNYSDSRRWRLNRYLDMLEAYGVDAGTLNANQSGMDGIAAMSIESAARHLCETNNNCMSYRELMQKLHDEEVIAFPR